MFPMVNEQMYSRVLYSSVQYLQPAMQWVSTRTVTLKRLKALRITDKTIAASRRLQLQ